MCTSPCLPSQSPVQTGLRMCVILIYSRTKTENMTLIGISICSKWSSKTTRHSNKRVNWNNLAIYIDKLISKLSLTLKAPMRKRKMFWKRKLKFYLKGKKQRKSSWSIKTTFSFLFLSMINFIHKSTCWGKPWLSSSFWLKSNSLNIKECNVKQKEIH